MRDKPLEVGEFLESLSKAGVVWKLSEECRAKQSEDRNLSSLSMFQRC